MTDGYAQLTVIDFLVAYLASKMMGGGEREREREGEREREREREKGKDKS